jgi:predicted N-acetyltransferase YhbS
MTDELLIRPMESADVDRVSEVIVAAVRADLPARYPPDVVAGLAAGNDPRAVAGHAPKQADYVCLHDGRIVAMIGLKRNEIGHLFVEPAAAGRGVGRRLVRFAVEQFRQAGYADMIVLSSLNAVGFYARCGFVEEGRGSFPVGENLPLEFVRMRASLE